MAKISLEESSRLFYTPPEDKLFEELKALAIDLWRTYDNTYGYVDEKLGRIKDLDNVQGNFAYIFAMFDPRNQLTILARGSDKLTFALIERFPNYIA